MTCSKGLVALMQHELCMLQHNLHPSGMSSRQGWLAQVLQRAEEVCVISAEATQEAATEVRLAQLALDFGKLDVPVQSLVDLPDVYVLGDLAVCHAGLEDCLATAHSILGLRCVSLADANQFAAFAPLFALNVQVWLGWDLAVLSRESCWQQAKLLLPGSEHRCAGA